MAYLSERQGKMPPQPLRVFIADDSAPVAEMLTELLVSPGRVEVVGVAGTEREVIDSILSLRPDVVVLDLQLKDGSGTNVIKAVRASPVLPAIRLLVTSNHTSPQLRAGCLQLGADDYFDKVKGLGLLSTRIAELAEGKDQ
jgi:DNA-binding NarL/FixJ family response regulator